MVVKGLKNVDMGSKSLSECLKQTQVGIIPGVIKTQDETGCVGNQKNVNWRAEDAARRSEGLWTLWATHFSLQQWFFMHSNINIFK